MFRSNKPDAAAPVAPVDPQAGGSYVRNADGTLTQVQQTQDGRRRAKREPDAPDAPATTVQLPE